MLYHRTILQAINKAIASDSEQQIESAVRLDKRCLNILQARVRDIEFPLHSAAF